MQVERLKQHREWHKWDSMCGEACHLQQTCTPFTSDHSTHRPTRRPNNFNTLSLHGQSRCRFPLTLACRTLWNGYFLSFGNFLIAKCKMAAIRHLANHTIFYTSGPRWARRTNKVSFRNTISSVNIAYIEGVPGTCCNRNYFANMHFCKVPFSP